MLNTARIKRKLPFIHHYFRLRATVNCNSHNLCSVSQVRLSEKQILESKAFLLITFQFYLAVKLVQIAAWPLHFHKTVQLLKLVRMKTDLLNKSEFAFKVCLSVEIRSFNITNGVLFSSIQNDHVTRNYLII